MSIELLKEKTKQSTAMKIHNFSAGPAILPPSVIKEAAKGVLNLNGTGLSVLEMSHRSKDIGAVMDEATALVKELMHLPDNYDVVWLTGGASTQFLMAPMNLLNANETAAYIDTGTWASKAIEAAQDFGTIEVLASSKETNYDHIPHQYKIPKNAKYLHLTSNNTIFGTQLHRLPKTDIPIVCDMSSDFMSRPVDVERYGLIYAGAQKNLGPAGVTCVIIRNDMLGKVSHKLPKMLDYRTFIKEKSLYNTPPVFAIYVSMLTLRWIKGLGGLEAMAKHNKKKANVLYKEIDANPLFKGNVEKRDRSLMNICFTMYNRDLEPQFAQFAKANGVQGIEGHRSVGGFRASTYNAMPIKSVKLLADLMQEFAIKHG
jgi:phosphoserine aminotransferase